MDFGLQVFKFETVTKNSGSASVLPWVDCSKANKNPANFVCMLPLKIELIKGKSLNTFGELFGEKSSDFAVELLKKALLTERDAEIKAELEKRLKILDPKQTIRIVCCGCKKSFEISKRKKYKHPLCDECAQKRFSRKSSAFP